VGGDANRERADRNSVGSGARRDQVGAIVSGLHAVKDKMTFIDGEKVFDSD